MNNIIRQSYCHPVNSIRNQSYLNQGNRIIAPTYTVVWLVNNKNSWKWFCMVFRLKGLNIKIEYSCLVYYNICWATSGLKILVYYFLDYNKYHSTSVQCIISIHNPAISIQQSCGLMPLVLFLFSDSNINWKPDPPPIIFLSMNSETSFLIIHLRHEIRR